MKEQNMLIEPTKMMKITEAKQTKKTSKMRSIQFGRGLGMIIEPIVV